MSFPLSALCPTLPLTFPLVLLPLSSPFPSSCLFSPVLPHPNSIPRCCLAPASAVKFPEAVQAAGLTPKTPAEILALEHRETRCIPMRRGDDWTQMLQDTIEGLSQRWKGCVVNSSE